MTGPFEFEIGPSGNQTGRWFRQRGNIVIVLDNSVPPFLRRATFQREFGEITPDTCRPGEGPPAAAPDPEGRGPHPLVYRGTSATRSRNPTVGDAQILLNNFLARIDQTFSTCTFGPGGLERARRLLAELNAAGENPLAVDCRFGPNTERATKLFQLCKGIKDDGKIGPVTWPLLETFRRRVPPPPPPVLRLNPPRWRPILRGVLSPHAALRDGNAVLSMIDGVETFRPVVDAIRRTSGERDYIYLLGWRLIDDFELIPCDPTTTARRLLADASARGVQIRAMLWDQPGTANSPEVARIDALPTGAAILDNETPNPIAAFGSHHQKVLVAKVGGRLIGFCGGADINSDRIDPCPISSGSGASSSSGIPSGGTGPLHDTQCQVIGPSAWDLLQTFIRRWDHHPDHITKDATRGALVGRSEPIPGPLLSPPLGSSKVAQVCSVVIARTFTPVTGGATVPKERDIRALLLQSIAHAQRFIYMEDQYLINREAAVALNGAVPRLRHLTILITASETVIELMCPWKFHRDFIADLTRGLSPADLAKVRIFQLVTPPPATPPRLGRHTWVHSKAWVFDDELAVIGSANCNRRGWQHDSEANAFIFDSSIPPSRADTFAQDFRARLWAEHLNTTTASVRDGVASAGLWLSPPAGARVMRYNPTAGTDTLPDRVCEASRFQVDPFIP